MNEVMEKLKQVDRILTGDEGPNLTGNPLDNERYVYPERIALALRVLAEVDYLIKQMEVSNDKQGN